jgi:ATP-binding cassette subfamily B protein
VTAPAGDAHAIADVAEAGDTRAPKAGVARTEGARKDSGALRPLRALWPFIAPYRLQVVLALFFLALAAGATLALPATVRTLVDQGLTAPGDTAARLVAVREQFLLLFAVAVGLALSTAARFFTVSWIGERVTADLRAAVYAHVLRQSPVFFETLRTGEVLSRLTSDTTVIQSAVGSSISMGLRSAVMCAGALGMLVATHPRLMLTVVGIIVGVVLPALAIGTRVRRLSRASQDRIADTSAVAAEILPAISVVQSFTQETAEVARFGAANARAFATAVRRIGTRAAFTAFLITGVFGSLLYGLYGGVQAVMAGQLSAGELSQTALYIMLVASSFAVLAEVWGDLLRAAGATERLVELLVTQPQIADLPRAQALPAATARALRFEDVHFHYPSRPQQPVLQGLDVDIPAGATVALVGPSGAGKSTVFALLQRFYEIQAGRILLDGHAVGGLTLASLRGSIAVVPQDPVIFSGTLAENIAYGRPGAGPEEVRAAARAAHVEAFALQLPEGYETAVGERGLRLSGGQRQRVAIARAILKDAPLLLLDEATSSLDAESERAVQQALEGAMRGRTTLVIAHRLATVQRADRILVLDAGRIVESGRHAELLAAGGLYARLAALQFNNH